eukprot:gi/632987625/ref/XP_007882659.1/ PREDICTED: ATPase SWSAP1 [Callorhinchus milii]
MARLLQHVLLSPGGGQMAPQPRCPVGLPACLLLGEPSWGKTHLLFLTAARTASQEGKQVLFISPGPVQALPSPLLALDPMSLKRIQFLYPRTFEDLLHRLASLHETEGALPSLVLLEGLESYLEGTNDQRAVLISALLLDTVAFCSQKLRSGPGSGCQGCQLIVSLQVRTNPRVRCLPLDVKGIRRLSARS